MSETQNKYWLGRVAAGDIMFGPFSEQRAGFSGLADMKGNSAARRRLEALRQRRPGARCARHRHHPRRTRRSPTPTATFRRLSGAGQRESFFIGDFTVDENGQAMASAHREE